MEYPVQINFSRVLHLDIELATEVDIKWRVSHCQQFSSKIQIAPSGDSTGPVMDQYISDILELSVPWNPSLWMPAEDGQRISAYPDWSASSSPTFPLREQNGDFYIQPESLVVIERRFSSAEQKDLPPFQHKPTESARVQRRRFQNRRSQQAFRERQAQRIQSLEERIEELLKRRNDNKEGLQRVETLEGTVDELSKQKEESDKKYSDLKAKYDLLKEDLKRLAA